MSPLPLPTRAGEFPVSDSNTYWSLALTGARRRLKWGSALLTAHSVVSEHGGEIEIHSEGGKGTTVTVRLPLTVDPGE